MEERRIELRRLKAEDLFPMATILSKIGFKKFKGSLDIDNIKELLGQGESQEDVGALVMANIVFDVVGIILENLEACKDDLFRLLSRLSGLKTNEIADLDGVEFFDLLVDFVSMPQFKDFFQRASKFAKKMN